MPYSPSIPMRRGRGVTGPPLTACPIVDGEIRGSDEARRPRLRNERGLDLDGEMICEWLRPVSRYPLDDALQSLAQRDRGAIAEQASRLVGTTSRVPHFARAIRNENGIETEVHQLSNDLRELEDGEVFLVGTDVDDFARQSRLRSHLDERVYAILNE